MTETVDVDILVTPRYGDKKIMNIVGRGVLTPLFYEDPSYIFSNFVQPPSPVATNPHPHCSFCCLVSMTEWVIMPHLMCYFTYWFYGSINVEPWYLRTIRTLMCVLWNTKWHQVYCGLTHVISCWYSDLISHTHKHTHARKETQHTQGPVDWRTHINKLTQP